MFILMGCVVYFGTALIDYRWVKWLAIPMYLGGVGLAGDVDDGDLAVAPGSGGAPAADSWYPVQLSTDEFCVGGGDYFVGSRPLTSCRDFTAYFRGADGEAFASGT